MRPPVSLADYAALLTRYNQLDALGLAGHVSAGAVEERTRLDELLVDYIEGLTADIADNRVAVDESHLALTVLCGLTVRLLLMLRERGR